MLSFRVETQKPFAWSTNERMQFQYESWKSDKTSIIIQQPHFQLCCGRGEEVCKL